MHTSALQKPFLTPPNATLGWIQLKSENKPKISIPLLAEPWVLNTGVLQRTVYKDVLEHMCNVIHNFLANFPSLNHALNVFMIS
jgi:hypothetical protein